MGWTFIALEDPFASLKYVEKKAKSAKEKQAEAKRQKKYERRNQFLAEHEGVLDHGQLELDEVAIDRFCRNQKTAKWAKVKSLTQAMHQIAALRDSFKEGLSTLVFVGHGSATGMGVGLGEGPIGEQHFEGIERKEKLKAEAREVFNLGKKMIGFSNVDDWTALFTQLKGVAEVDKENGFFNVLLLGCSTGEWEHGEGGNEVLLQFVARNVAEVLQIPVAAFGLTKTIGRSKTEKIFLELAEVKRAALGTADYDLGGDLFVTFATS